MGSPRTVSYGYECGCTAGYVFRQRSELGIAYVQLGGDETE